MTAIAAKDVQELRKATGAGMMDAKKALTEAGGDQERATQILREKGLAKAAGRTDRDNAEGLVAIARDGSTAALIHLRSETDFAAKSDDFRAMAQQLVDLVLASGPDALADPKIGTKLEDLKLTVKENIEVGTAVRYEAPAGHALDAYLHGEGRAGLLIEGEGIEPETLHEIALHATFAKPAYLRREDVPAGDVEAERAALIEITKAEGKPEQAWPKIVEGRLNSWYGERVLLEQGVFGDKETVASRIGSGSITRLTLAVVGG